jgi:Cu(I)/Ag(I) efflux system membrane fusion protein
MNQFITRIFTVCWVTSLFGLLVATALVSCDRSPSKKATSGSAETDQKQLWTCPMHPQILKDQPGTCPICSMSLVKKEKLKSSGGADQRSFPTGHAAFHLSEGRSQMIGVKWGVVKSEALFRAIEAAGRVAFDPELYTAQTEYLEAMRQFSRVQNSPLSDVKHSAESMIQSAKLRLKILGLSDAQIQQIGNGSVSGANLLVPQKGENIWVYAEVFEMDLSSVMPGLEAVVSGGSLGSKKLFGKVASVDRVINPVTRTAKVRVQVPNAKSELRPESYVDVSIRSPLGVQTTVPFDAVLDTGKEAWVFVTKASGEFEPRLIQIRMRVDDVIAIESGLKAGERIVTSANFLIDSESRLKGVLLSQEESRDESQEESREEPAQKVKPKCPPGQEWHSEMNHCMAIVPSGG